MNEKLPKSMLDALASQAPQQEHPSADVLTAYMEQSLAEAERSTVADHLAQCRECREVVFLASGAGEESQELALVAAAAAPKPRPRWTPRLLWVASVAAGVLVVGYVAWNRSAKPETAPLVASNEAQQPRAVPAQPPQESVQQLQKSSDVAAPPANAPMRQVGTPKKAAPAAAIAPATSAELKQLNAQSRVAAPGMPQKNDAVAARAETPKAAPEPATIAISPASTPRPMSPHVSAFAPSAAGEGEQRAGAAALGLYSSRALTAAGSSAHPGWRVNAEGQLEHLTADGWSRALADQAVTFRVVNARGNEVWAGGDGGALFHSSDGGAQWKKVVLSTDGVSETATIATIRFSSQQNGVVITST